MTFRTLRAQRHNCECPSLQVIFWDINMIHALQHIGNRVLYRSLQNIFYLLSCLLGLVVLLCQIVLGPQVRKIHFEVLLFTLAQGLRTFLLKPTLVKAEKRENTKKCFTLTSSKTILPFSGAYKNFLFLISFLTIVL